MNATSSPIRTLLTGSAALVVVLACASPYPAVITSTPDKVAVEFEKDGNLEDASKLAQAECARFGRTADFDAVDVNATPGTRVARFRCVAEPSAAPAAAAPAPAPEGEASGSPDAAAAP